MKAAHARSMLLGVSLLLWWSCDRPVAEPMLRASYSYNDEDSDSDSDSDNRRSEHAPDLRDIARFTQKPAPPDPLNDHKWIGPEGGSLRVGDFEIMVPAGALDKNVHFRIRRPVDPRAADHAYAAFTPHMAFHKPVTIRLPRATTNAADAPFVMWWSGAAWLPLETRLTEDGRIEAEVSHFSYYGTSRWGKGVTTLGG